MKKYSIFLSTLFLACSTHSSAFAWGNKAGDLTLSGGGGYYWFDSQREIQDRGLPFAIAGFNLTDNWTVEAMWAGVVTRFEDVVHDDREINATLVTLDALYRFGDFCHFEPYVLGGFGMLGLNHNRENANNEGNLNVGVGAQFFIADQLAFRADVRDLYTINGGKNDVMANVGMTLLINLC